jgi:hypothetical protein
MSESVIHLFEVIEIPVKGKAASGLQRAEAGLKLLAEVCRLAISVSVSWRANQSTFCSA